MSKLSLKNEQFQTGNSRYASRHALRLDAVLADTGAQITILNLSPTGLLIETEQALGKGDTVLIDMPDRGPTSATVVWGTERYFGCEFELNVSSAAVSASLLKSKPGLPDASVTSDTPELSEVDLEDVPFLDDRYSLRTRALVIVGSTLFSWALIGYGALKLL
jgi:hypothetical protein